jgi:two-component system OmpR family sensor kinase
VSEEPGPPGSVWSRSPAGRGASRVRRWSGGLPLRVKLVAAVLALVVVGLSLAGIAAATALHGYLLGRVDDQLRGAAAGQLRNGGPFDHATGNRPPTQYYTAAVLTTGQVAEVISVPAAGGTPDIPPQTAEVVQQRGGEPFSVGPATGSDGWRVVVLPVRDPGTGTLLGSAVIAVSLADVNHTVGRLVFLEVSIGAGVVLVTGLLGYVVVRRSLRPLVEVERTAAAIAGGDLSRRVPERPPRTEVGRLSAALNGMLGQIESAFRVREASESSARRSEESARESEERMRRFVADASHELRTPLTSIRGFAELYRQGAAGNPDDLARVMRRIEDESARMGLLVDDLLLLARLDQQRPLERHPVDVLALAADAVHDARAVAPDRTIELSLADGPVAPVVVGDEHRLRQVVGNLLANALTHTPPGTPVAVRVTTGPGTVVLEVSDRGPGLAPAEADRVFERFYRADPSRTRASGGTGLGLSIVAALIAAHAGTVELDSRPGEGATFRVILPAAEPHQPAVTGPAQARPSRYSSEAPKLGITDVPEQVEHR